jgi:hypothetical protein
VAYIWFNLFLKLSHLWISREYKWITRCILLFINFPAVLYVPIFVNICAHFLLKIDEHCGHRRHERQRLLNSNFSSSA